MRKLITLIMATMLLFALVGCGDFLYRSEYDIYHADISEDIVDIGDRIEYIEQNLVLELYVKTEPDGDYEVLCRTITGWFYRQCLGGEICEDSYLGEISIQEVMTHFGTHFDEFVRIF